MRALEIAWFLARRPSYYPELLRRIRLRAGGMLLPPPMGRSRAVAESWAHAVAVTPEAFLAEHFGASVLRLADRHPEIVDEAKRRAAACPALMGGEGALDLLFSLAEAMGARTAVETGVAYGWSTLALLLSVTPRGGRVFSVDMEYPGRANGAWVGCVVPTDLRASWTLIRRPDYVGLPPLLRGIATLDLCHYDSDKSYHGRSWAYPRLWAALRPGGVFVSDDIGDNTAFRDFAQEIAQTPHVISYRKGDQEHLVGVLIKGSPLRA